MAATIVFETKAPLDVFKNSTQEGRRTSVDKSRLTSPTLKGQTSGLWFGTRANSVRRSNIWLGLFGDAEVRGDADIAMPNLLDDRRSSPVKTRAKRDPSETRNEDLDSARVFPSGLKKIQLTPRPSRHERAQRAPTRHSETKVAC